MIGARRVLDKVLSVPMRDESFNCTFIHSSFTNKSNIA